MNMEYEIKRLDHLGIVAGTIKDLGIVETIDAIIGTDKREEVSTGECVAAMILNGLGFTSKPLSLTEKFFEKKPLELFFSRKNILPSYFNRDKLGKSLDKLHVYGCEQLFYQCSLTACSSADINLTYNSLDTTSLSLTGAYDSCSDEHELQVVHGFSKDHRPDLKQCIHELLVSQDGGVPLMMKSWSGNSSDNAIFKERSKRLISNFKKSESLRYLIADSKLYNSKNATNLQQLNFVTRIPGSIKEVNSLILDCFKKNKWKMINKCDSYSSININHYGINQRWIAVKSNQSESRAKKRINKAVLKEHSDYSKKLKEFTKQKFSDSSDAISNLKVICQKLKYHKLSTYSINKTEDEETKFYTIQGKLAVNSTAVDISIKKNSCYIIGTNISANEVEDTDIISIYKKQNIAIENTGFRFLKDPKFFAQSFFVKKTSRIESLLFIMTLSLLVYSIAQRNLRKKLASQSDTLPDQIKRETSKPTLRWVFQMLEDINILYKKTLTKVTLIVEGINQIKTKILSFFSENVRKIYETNLSYVT